MDVPLRNRRQFRYKVFLKLAIWSSVMLLLDFHTIGAMTSRVKIRELVSEKLSCNDENDIITIKPRNMLVKGRDMDEKLVNCNRVVYKHILKACLLQRRCGILLQDGELSTCDTFAGNRATQVEVGYDCMNSDVASFCGGGNFQKYRGYLKSPNPIDGRIRQCTCSFTGLSPDSAYVRLNLVYQDYDTRHQKIEVFYNNDEKPVEWANAEYTPFVVMDGDFQVKFTNDPKSMGGYFILWYTGTGHVFNIRCEALYENAGAMNETLIAVIALVVVVVAVVVFVIIGWMYRKRLQKNKQGRGKIQNERPVVLLNQIDHNDSEEQSSGDHSVGQTDGEHQPSPNDNSNQATDAEHVYDSARHTEEDVDNSNTTADVSYYSHLRSGGQDHEYDSLESRPVDVNIQNPSSDVTGANEFDVNDMYEATGDKSGHSPQNETRIPGKTVVTSPRYDLEENAIYTSPDEPIESVDSFHDQTNESPISVTTNSQITEENDTYQPASSAELEENDTYTSRDEPISEVVTSDDQIKEAPNHVTTSNPVIEENDTYISTTE